MLCYRCGSHVPDTADSCGTCGQKLAGGGVRQATATFSRRKLAGAQLENAPYKIGDVVSNRYEIRDVVGAGPVGFVFRAKDREVDVEVALKVVHSRLVQTPEERKQFGKAIRLGRKLSHQNLIRVYEEGEESDQPYYTMQFLEGLNLRKIIDLRIQKNEFFSLKEIEPILAQIAAALDAAHKVGPHSNIKPENVIVLPDLLKVSDFGLGLAIPRLPFVQAAKQRKADRYLAPEYVQGSEIDQRADIYSLAVILGEMLSGLTPDESVPELGRRNPEVPAPVEGLYRKGLNSNPLARPKTAGEFMGELSEIIRRVSPPPLRRAEPPSPAVQRNRPPPPVPTMSAGPSATVELRRRTVEKPPPPVPDEDVHSVEVAVNGHSGEIYPPDATQPLNTSEIPIPPPPPPEAGAEETQLMPSFPGLANVELVGEPTESRPIPREKGKTGIWFFALFTLAGLSLGAAGGYWLLGRMRQPPRPATTQVVPMPVTAPVVEAPKPSTQTPPEAVAETPKTQPAPATATPTPAPTPTPAAPVASAKSTSNEEAKRRAEAERLEAETRRRVEEAAKAEAARLAEEKRKAEQEAARLAEEKRIADEKRVAEEKKATVVAAAAATPKADCPDGMRLIKSGSFRMGTARDDPMMGFDEKILSSATTGAYCIDVYEYPNRRGSMPKVGVSFTDAKRLCEARQKRLCSEEEWERACKGPGNARYPYGNTFDADTCNTEDSLGEDRPLATAGRFSKCRSGYGVADMSGNAAEWTASPYAGGSDRAQKGGSFSKPDYAARCSARKNGSPGSRGADVGFRCCADP